MAGPPRERACDVAELGRLIVAPDRQGRGTGSLLLAQVEEVWSDAGEIRLFTGENSLANIRLYSRNGYTETGRTTAGNYALVHMAKTTS